MRVLCHAARHSFNSGTLPCAIFLVFIFCVFFTSRYLLVASEEERKSILEGRAVTTPVVKSSLTTVAQEPVRHGSQRLQQIINIAQRLKIFSSPLVLNHFGKFFDQSFSEMLPADLTGLITEAVDAGEIEARLVPTEKILLSGRDPGGENRVEPSLVFISRATATEQNVADYISDWTLKTTLSVCKQEISPHSYLRTRGCGRVGPRGHGLRASRNLKVKQRKEAGLGRGLKTQGQRGLTPAPSHLDSPPPCLRNMVNVRKV